MADDPTTRGGGNRHLDASGEREVVFCHLCAEEWYRDEHGLPCPACGSDITEIITPESDPRPGRDEPVTPPDLRELRRHNPWSHPNGSDSDPEEADIEEHVSHGPGGSVIFSQTIRSSGPTVPFGTRPPQHTHGRRFPEDDPDHVMADFHSMLGSMMGPGLRPGQTGRSNGEQMFARNPFGESTFQTTTRGPNVVGGRFTFTTGVRPRDANGAQPGGQPGDEIATYAPTPNPLNGRSLFVVSIRAPPDQLSRLLGSLFGTAPGGLGGQGHDPNAPGGHPSPFQGLLASLLNPANARHGDAVYTQEALDQIISTLMEQHPTSNAPGPASADAISSLPKTILDEKLLGPEGKGECSVCMDDVQLGDEVVTLPCKHWFHEQCASLWLSEHNTCPICRKGIDGDTPPPSTSRRSSNGPPSPRTERRSSRLSLTRPRMSRDNTSSRNEARLDAIRNNGRLSTTEENQGSTTSSTRRYQVVGVGEDRRDRPSILRPRETAEEADPSRDMPGSFSSFTRTRDERQSSRRESSGRNNTSGSDHSRSSRRSSRSGESTGNGALSWLRDRFGSGRRSSQD
ncbi:putative RING finger protein [Lachnellula suecica]|uniref:RING-type E3 ubiquitin transferase n=1 Tax=Lachnellula suecica TaxID=602035 RepID=A0A8T9C746_9HELO|nr:putative RING finger protein [Lachnellula suecica]